MRHQASRACAIATLNLMIKGGPMKLNETVVRVIRLILWLVLAVWGAGAIMAWLAMGGVIGLWVGIPCLAFAGYLVFLWARRKLLVRNLIREAREESRR